MRDPDQLHENRLFPPVSEVMSGLSRSPVLCFGYHCLTLVHCFSREYISFKIFIPAFFGEGVQ